MFYLRYLSAELRRRRGRTTLTAIGLAIGIGLVVTVSALSHGLDSAQQKVLEPLTGVGTDMSVSRPIQVSGSGSKQSFSAGPSQLAPKEQRQLRKENANAEVNLQRTLSKLAPGQRFSVDQFVSTNLSFPEREAKRIDRIDGVARAGPALTLNAVHVSGKAPPSAGPAGVAAPESLSVPPKDLKVDQETISGVDASQPALALVTPAQISSGRYLPKKANRKAVVSQAYADQNGVRVGDRVSVGRESFRVVGIARPPIGGESSDVYVPLGALQRLTGRQGRINVLQVRADSASQVGAVSAQIKRTFAGAKVTTAQDLANRVSGSLVDAKDLSDKLGAALALVALVAACLIASLLTVSSINRRTREIGTLKAVGWRQGLVVRQVIAETLAQGLLGGLIGVLLGLAGTALVKALGISLKASVGAAQNAGPLAFGPGRVTAGSSTVTLSPTVSAGIVLLAVALAIAGGLIAGAVGASRAARLRPAEALRSVE